MCLFSPFSLRTLLKSTIFQVYSDLEVCFAVSENLSFLRGLSERRGSFFFPCPTPSLPQLYYGAILQELIAFQMPSKDSKIQLVSFPLNFFLSHIQNSFFFTLHFPLRGFQLRNPNPSLFLSEPSKIFLHS